MKLVEAFNQTGQEHNTHTHTNMLGEKHKQIGILASTINILKPTPINQNQSVKIKSNPSMHLNGREMKKREAAR